jgi:aspartyl-tRNA(Asn)/glutamyl-tRNA(Gln) amidotransferase subunit A
MRLHYPTLAEAAARLRTGELSPVALAQDCLKRIGALDSRLHAFITVTAERAQMDAEAAEREIRGGHYRGPLHGVPIALKDIVWTRGIRTTAHSKRVLDFVPSEDAAVYEKLRAAGAVLLGKTSLHEFAYGNPVPDAPFPAARNPWNTEYAPGRSSSGSGAAVAAGLCLGAIGTDTGGSIRHPAAVCGIVGMKPTFGRVSCHGVIPLAAAFDHVGPMTRTVRDNALMLQAMAGHDPRDSASVARPVPDFAAGIGRDLRGVRVGVPRRVLEALPVEPSIGRAFEDALRVLASLGAAIEDIEIDGLLHAVQAGAMLVVAQAYRYHGADLKSHPNKYGKAFRERVLKAADFTDEQLTAANETRVRLCAALDAVFASGTDIVAGPTKEIAAETMRSLYEEPVDTRPGLIRVANMTGSPALSVPMGFDSLGIPAGMQLTARHWHEPLLYQVAAAYEAATPWVNRHPDLGSQA